MTEPITWTTTHGDRVEVFLGYRWMTAAGWENRYGYRVRAANNRIVETGSEGYTRRSAAVKAAERHHPRVES